MLKYLPMIFLVLFAVLSAALHRDLSASIYMSAAWICFYLSREAEMKWWLIERWGFGNGLRRRGINFARYYFARARHVTMRDMDIIRISERSLSGARSSR